MATIRAKKVKSVVAKVKTKKGEEKDRAKPFPALPRNAEGAELNKYTSVVSVQLDKESMPSESMFVDSLHYWESLVTYLTERLERADSMVEKLRGMTAEDRAKERADRNALKRAQASASKPEVQQLAMDELLADPTKLDKLATDPLKLAAFLAAAQARLAAMTAG